jgi:ribosomal protein S18 acetylase RimI-like enzyme
MLAVDKEFRHKGIGSKLVSQSIEAMQQDKAEEVLYPMEIVLEISE